MALSFIQHGITAKKRMNRKSTPTLMTWDGLVKHFQDQVMGDDIEKLIRETKFAKTNTPEYPMECRLMFGNANVPFGYRDGSSEEDLVKSIPCKDVEQGKKILTEVIQAIETDNDVRKVVAKFFKNRKGFDSLTIPSDLLGGA
jgi:hypothetical protein